MLVSNALVAFLSLAGPELPGRAPGSSPKNLGVAAQPGSRLEAFGSFCYLVVDEGDQGASDLNGDGDALDLVLFEYELASGTLTNLGIAILRGIPFQSLVAQDPFAVFLVPESDQGVDLNGDGDLQDVVVHAHDSRTGRTYDLAESWSGGVSFAPNYRQRSLTDGQRIVLPLTETTSDLNGDGDLLDAFVVATWSPAAGLQAYPLQGFPVFAGAEVRVHVSETTVDLNGDGDATDPSVLHRLDPASGAITNLGLAGYAYSESDLLTVVEASQNVDLDGNGLLDGQVAHALDPISGTVTNLGVRTFVQSFGVIGLSGLPLYPQQVALDWLPFASEEAAVDLNGDGDLLDAVLHVWDSTLPNAINLGATTTLPIATYTSASGVRTVLTTGFEPFSGIDGNGDGDLLDQYPLLVDEQGVAQPVSVALTPTGPNDAPIRVDGRWAAFLADETGQGVDLNGDGDLQDSIVVGLDLETRRVIRTNWPTGLYDLRIDGPWIYAFVEENGADLNSDGDGLDEVLHVLDASTRQRTNLGLAGYSAKAYESVYGDGGRALFFVHEPAHGDMDLNGDGDALDWVLFAL